jgi:type VI secretion system protein ImpC
MSSVQYSLSRIRSARVTITYDVEIGNATVKQELPFVVGILADLAGDNVSTLLPTKERPFIEIDGENFNSVMRSINPKISITTDDSKRIALSFNSIEDFSPEFIVRQVPQMKKILDTRVALIDLIAKLDGNEKFATLLFDIIKDKNLQTSIISEEASTDAPTIRKLLEQTNSLKDNANFEYLKGLLIACAKVSNKNDTSNVTNEYHFFMQCINDLDNQLSKQLDIVIHSPEFQKLEASWRGLHSLISKTEISTRLKLRVLPITKQELTIDLEKAIEFDQSSLFKKIYEQEYGTLGGTPFSCLIGDFYFGRNEADVKLLRNIATVASAAHAPFMAAAHHSMFDIENFTQLHTPKDLAKMFESSELASWIGFRNTEDSRYVSLVLPRILIRAPYGSKTVPCREFNYEEEIDGTDNQKFCWGNPVYALAQKITAAFAEYGWTSAIRGIEGGGKVEDLPTYTYKTSNGDLEFKCPTETAVTDRREKELSDLGFITLCHAKGTNYAVFFGAQSVQKPKLYNTPDANANASVSARLPYILNASRFVHYIKVMMREKIGSFMERTDIEVYLHNWLTDHVLLSPNASHALRAQYPLSAGKVNVYDVPGNPGSYTAIITISPFSQFESIKASVRMVASIGGETKGGE